RLSIEVFQEELRAGALGERGRPLEALEARRAPRGVVAGEVVAAVDDDPAGAKAPRELDIDPEVLVRGIGQERRGLGDVDRGGRRGHAVASATRSCRSSRICAPSQGVLVLMTLLLATRSRWCAAVAPARSRRSGTE